MAELSDDEIFHGHAYVHGTASGKLLASNLELSFWGGVNPETGEIIDRHHDLSGLHLQNAILAIPGGRGSCTGSGVILELLLGGKGPSAMIFERREDILTLGVMIAQEVFGKAIPVVMLKPSEFRSLGNFNGRHVHISGNRVFVTDATHDPTLDFSPDHSHNVTPLRNDITYSALDQEFLEGIHGEAARISMRIILRMAKLMGATELMDITQVHVDGCIYIGPGSLAFAERLRDWSGTVRVPTSMNSISIDQKRWKTQGVNAAFAEAAERLANAYTEMGARPTFTCAPYQLPTAPKLGEHIAWAESNAVVYANSVLGARTTKYPDFLDIAIALTGRAPKGGLHLDINRRASLVAHVLKEVHRSGKIDDCFWPLLGYHVGSITCHRIPVIVGIDCLSPSTDNLKAFGAALATTSSAPMFHIVGVTPEASSLDAVITTDEPTSRATVRIADLTACWDKLNSAGANQAIGLISFGTPHFSLKEVKALAELCQGRQKHSSVTVMVTCSRSTYGLADQADFITKLEDFGVQFVTDTCWCMITEPVIASSTKVIMTNSGKYAHYGPGLTGRGFYFGSLAQCVDAACQGTYTREMPEWLSASPKSNGILDISLC